jgi:hypothetical protein
MCACISSVATTSKSKRVFRELSDGTHGSRELSEVRAWDARDKRTFGVERAMEGVCGVEEGTEDVRVEVLAHSTPDRARSRWPWLCNCSARRRLALRRLSN